EQVGEALDHEARQGEKADPAVLQDLSARLKALQEDHKKLFTSNEIDRLYTEQGAVNLNASTGQDLTTYHVSLPANRLELWARIESDRMTRPLFREFYSERDVVLEERRQRSEADPAGLLVERYLATAFTTHPYRRPIIGWPGEIPFLDPDYLRQFFHRTHVPNNMVIAMVGDVKPAAALALVERYFGWIPSRPLNQSSPAKEPPQAEERRAEVPFSADPQLIMGFHKPPPQARADYALDLLESLLSEGKTSRLYRSVVKGKGIAKSIQAYNGFPGVRYPNQFVLFATPRHPHTCQELEEAITSEIENLQRHPVPEAELRKVKNRIRTDFLRRLNSNGGLAGMLSYYEAALGDYRYLLRYPEVIDEITASEIQEAAATYLQRSNRTVATLFRKPLPEPRGSQ
ncbi:MAG: insulinase family protein, partial [Syntrophaceae bacterium]|nr:insulinase family protein [Syntrophaceae bacterium]